MNSRLAAGLAYAPKWIFENTVNRRDSWSVVSGEWSRDGEGATSGIKSRSFKNPIIASIEGGYGLKEGTGPRSTYEESSLESGGGVSWELCDEKVAVESEESDPS